MVVAVFGVVTISALFAPGYAAAASGVPYTDARAVGTIGLCNAADQSVTTGKIADAPFVAKAIDSTAAPAPYNGADATATLFAYQPRKDVQPAEWYGEQLGASSRTSTPEHPTAVLTARDRTLADYLSDYPTKWDGLVELRVYLGAPGQPISSRTYDATDIKISGDSWQVVDGASVPCSTGQATSLEVALASAFPQLTASPSSGADASPTSPGGESSSGKSSDGKSSGVGATTSGVGSADGTDSPGGGAGSSSAAVLAGGQHPAGTAADTGSRGRGGTGPVLWTLTVVGIVGAAAAASAWVRSRPSPSRQH